MTSWRETTPQAVQDDLDGLLSVAMDRAEELLREHGEFFPFGLALAGDGTTTVFMGDPGQGARPPSQAVLDHLYTGVRQQAASLRAAAFVSDVRLVGRGDGVRVEAEHRDGGPAIAVVRSYTRSKLRKRVTFGEMGAMPGERRVWPG